MAKIQTVDYEAMPKQAQAMRNYGQELNSEMTQAYKSIADMHNVWYGKRYNELVKEFNNMIADINEMLNLVVTEIPFTLETIANNYSQADRGTNATNATQTAAKKITNINLANDVGMKFLTEEVSAIQSNVSKNFSNAKEKMNTIEVEYGKVTWQSEASEAFKSKFKKLKSEIIQSFEETSQLFTNLMNQTKDDIQTAENSSTVG